MFKKRESRTLSLIVVLNKLEDKSTFDASAIVCDGKLILRSNENLYCIGKN